MVQIIEDGNSTTNTGGLAILQTQVLPDNNNNNKMIVLLSFFVFVSVCGDRILSTVRWFSAQNLQVLKINEDGTYDLACCWACKKTQVPQVPETHSAASNCFWGGITLVMESQNDLNKSSQNPMIMIDDSRFDWFH